MFKNILNKARSGDQKGFTIIEVMIVLAIAGLILVVVLIAIPQLQRNQRNNARQTLLGRISTEVSNYAGNNNGTFPAPAVANTAGNFGDDTGDTNAFLGRYLASIDINDPSTGVAVTFVTAAGNVATPAQGEVRYSRSAECGVDGAITALTSQDRKFALAIGLEGGRAYCVDNG